MPSTQQEHDDREVTPTFWRGERSPVERLDDQIQDSNGNIGNPWVALTVLQVMERRGTITRDMALAGAKFHDDFARGCFENLRAADLNRLAGGKSPGMSMSSMEARARVHDAVGKLGGRTSPCGCCAWHVLGLEETLKDWATREGWVGRPIGEKTAAGLLIGALGVLKDHYE